MVVDGQPWDTVRCCHACERNLPSRGRTSAWECGKCGACAGSPMSATAGAWLADREASPSPETVFDRRIELESACGGVPGVSRSPTTNRRRRWSTILNGAAARNRSSTAIRGPEPARLRHLRQSHRRRPYPSPHRRLASRADLHPVRVMRASSMDRTIAAGTGAMRWTCKKVVRRMRCTKEEKVYG